MKDKLKGRARKVELIIIVRKNKSLRINRRTDSRFQINKSDVQDAQDFTFVGSIVSKNRGADDDTC